LNHAKVETGCEQLFAGLLRDFAPVIDKQDTLTAVPRTFHNTRGNDRFTRSGRCHDQDAALSGGDSGVNAGDPIFLVRPQLQRNRRDAR
jgi:hypothetical protein